MRPIRERIWRSTRVGVVGWLVFEHRGAVLTPLGGGTIAHSLIRPAHLAPCHDIRYSRCLPVNRLVRPIRERIWRSTSTGRHSVSGTMIERCGTDKYGSSDDRRLVRRRVPIDPLCHPSTHRVYMLRPIEGMTIPGNCCTIPGNTGSAKSWEFSRYYSQDFSDIVLFTYSAADSRYFVKVMVFTYVGTGNL